MQEQVERESVAITVKASKLTSETLAKVLATVGRKIKKEHHNDKTLRGRQTVKELMGHSVPTSTIPIDGDRGLFEHVARKWHVDYAFHKVGPKKYLLLFKTGQADAITGAFSEYSARMMKRAKDNRSPVMEDLKKSAERVERERPKHKERKREREAVHE